MDEADQPDEGQGARRRITARRVLLVLALVLLVAALVLWIQRRELATGLIDRELARRGIPASYRVTGIGFTRQRLEDVRIGDPARPDLVAAVVEVGIRLGLGGPVVTGLSADGVRLRGALRDGRLRFGALDRLMPADPGDDAPFALPDLDVALRDARLDLALPTGPLAIRLDGRGNLADGFAGSIVARTPGLGSGDCRAQGLVAAGAVSVEDASPAYRGPIRLGAVRCAGFAADDVALVLDAGLSPALDRWQGFADVETAALAGGGARLAAASGRVSFTGTSRETLGRIEATGRGLSAAGAAGDALRVELDYSVGAQSTADGRVRIENARLPGSLVDPVRRVATSLASLPVAPLIARLAERGGTALGRFSADGRLSLVTRDGRTALRLVELDARSASGGRLTLGGRRGFAAAWPGARLLLDGDLAMAGGGLPRVEASLRQAATDAPVVGDVRVAGYAADGARLALAPIRFTADGGTTRFRTGAVMTGPLVGGTIDGLHLPLAGRLDARGVTLDAGCLPLRYDRFRLGALDLQPGTLSACPEAAPRLMTASRLATIRVPDPVAAGRLGGGGFAFAAGQARLLGGGARFDVADARVAIGDSTRTVITAATLDGASAGGVLSGDFSGAGTRIGTVPLLIGDAAGTWRLDGGELTLGGAIGVTDTAPAPRFYRLTAADTRFRLVDNRITASATLGTPAGTPVARVDIRHFLGDGTGVADFTVPGIAFGPALQPDALTRLTVGVVADVAGSVDGRGRIAWGADGVASTGTFSTTDMALAAAFGPVEGFTTTVEFTDLLALHSAPGQVATLREVNPGIEIEDGLIRYQLLPDQVVAIENGTWPLEGGTLRLEPTRLDFSGEAVRRMEFRVEGLDAARFIDRFGFDDVVATGIFDGSLPIVFDRDGARIEGGVLGSREGGGTLGYTGEIGSDRFGTYGALAFDALRSLRYNGLTITLDGALDGEMVTQVRFAGVNRATPQTRASAILRQFTNLPFIFNIRIQAPFRGLLASLRSLGDADILVRDQLPEALRTRSSVQTPASEDER